MSQEQKIDPTITDQALDNALMRYRIDQSYSGPESHISHIALSTDDIDRFEQRHGYTLPQRLYGDNHALSFILACRRICASQQNRKDILDILEKLKTVDQDKHAKIDHIWLHPNSLQLQPEFNEILQTGSTSQIDWIINFFPQVLVPLNHMELKSIWDKMERRIHPRFTISKRVDDIISAHMLDRTRTFKEDQQEVKVAVQADERSMKPQDSGEPVLVNPARCRSASFSRPADAMPPMAADHNASSEVVLFAQDSQPTTP